MKFIQLTVVDDQEAQSTGIFQVSKIVGCIEQGPYVIINLEGHENYLTVVDPLESIQEKIYRTFRPAGELN